MHGSMPRVVLMYNSGILQVANALNAQAAYQHHELHLPNGKW